MQRGHVVLVDFEPVGGSEANKVRPAVVVGNEASLRAATRYERGVVTVVPITINRAVQGRMHVALRPTRLNGLRAESKAQVEQVRSLDIARVRASLGRLGPGDIQAIDEVLRYHLAL